MRARSMWTWLSASVAMVASQACSSASTSGGATNDGNDSAVAHVDSGAETSGTHPDGGNVDSGISEDTSIPTPGADSGPSDVDASTPGDDAVASTDASEDAPVDLPDAATTSPDAATATCGCNGAAGCAVWQNVYVTFYGFNDNSCTVESEHSCDDIAYPGLGPKKHAVATEGTGTYDDPITAAASDQGYESSGGATLEPGTIIYNPLVQKYFIMEDSCLECGDEWKCHLSSDDTDDPKPPSGCKASTYLHIDFWMGPDFASDTSTLNDCEDNSTLGDPYKGIGTVIVNPPSNLPVRAPLLFTGTGSAGGCWTTSQADPVSCP